MSGKTRWDYLKAIYLRYKKVSKAFRARILDEFCQVCNDNRKYAIRLLNGPAPQKPKTMVRKGRRPAYTCVFRIKPATDSGPNRPPNPGQTSHRGFVGLG